MARSNRSKVIEISQKTRRKVMERQDGLSITGRSLGNGVNYHHIVSKGSEGVGYEFNVIALTPDEHIEYHRGSSILTEHKGKLNRKEFDQFIDDYMKQIYSNWSRDKCKYVPGWTEEDYLKVIKGEK